MLDETKDRLFTANRETFPEAAERDFPGC